MNSKLLYKVALFFFLLLPCLYACFLFYVYADYTEDPAVIEVLVNKQRVDHGHAPLRSSEKLRKSACAKLDDMVVEGYFDHISPNDKKPWHFIEEAGYYFRASGENLARGFDTSEDVVSAWMASPGHRANILSDKYEDQGICTQSRTLQGRKQTISVQHFGKL